MSTAVEWTTNTLQLRQSMSDKQHKGVRTVDKPCTLAVCQVIVDKLPTESIWHEWGKDAHQPQDQPSSSTQVVATGGSRLRLKYHIHAARPTSVTSPWVRSRLLPLTFSPKWNDFRIVRAALELIREAVRDESVTHAVVVTESCIPLASFPTLYTDLLKIPTPTSPVPLPYKSYIPLVKTPSKFDTESIWTKLRMNGFTSQSVIKKALPGWTVMGRDDIIEILKTEELCYSCHSLNLWQAWENVWAPEEVYFPTIINAVNGMRNTEDRTINFAMWDERNKDHSKRANPIWFDGEFGVDIVREWRRGGSLFGRKFREVKGDVWRRVVAQVEREEEGETKNGPSKG